MTTYTHFGLYFTPDHVGAARKNRETEPLRAAWNLLLTTEQSTPLAAAQWNALRYRFNDDLQAGERALAALAEGVGLQPGGSLLAGFSDAVTTAQTFEMLADHPSFSWTAQGRWATRFAAHVDSLVRTAADIPYLERLWIGLLQLVAGIVLEDSIRMDAGVSVYRQVIESNIRPEGYIAQVVEGEDGASLYRQLRAVEALVLMAESASHVGLDLWGYTSRGVSVMTAAAYLVYYYYYADKWRWGAVAESDAQTWFRQHGGFLEILNAHAPLKDIKLLLTDLRPLYSPTAGGLTTLTHAQPTRRGFFR